MATKKTNLKSRSDAKKPDGSTDVQAPAPPAGGHAPNADPDEILRVPLKSVAPNPLNPRKTFDAAKLAELAASIASKGVLQPILVRPHPRAGALANVNYELVAGERRWRAAEQAGLKVIPAIVRNLDDRTCREIMLIENVQRADLTALEEAENYHELTKLGLSIEELAKRIGKSPSTIRNALKLLDLPKPAQDALAAGRLPASIATLIARIPGKHTRELAAAHILAGKDWWNDKAPKIAAGAEPLSFRAAKELIEENCMVELKAAPFDRKALDLVPGVPSCDACPKRVGNLAKLDPEAYEGARADVCTDPDCYAEKVKAHSERLKAQAEAGGKKVLPKEEAEKIFSGASVSYFSPYVDVIDLSAKDRAALDESKIVLAVDESGQMHELVKKTALPKSSANGVHSHRRHVPTAKEREQQKLRRETIRAQLAELADKATDHFLQVPTRPQTCAMLRHMIRASLGWGEVRDEVLARHGCTGRTTTERFQALDKHCETLDAPALFSLLVEFKCGPAVAGDRYGREREHAALAQALKLTPRAKMQQQVRARLTASVSERSTAGPKLSSKGKRIDLADIDGLTWEEVEAAYVVHLWTNGKVPTKPVDVKTFRLDGRLWVSLGGIYGPQEAERSIAPLYLISDYRAKFGSQPRKLQPPVNPNEEERRELYTGVLVSVRGETYAIGPASEKRVIFSKKHGNYAKVESAKAKARAGK